MDKISSLIETYALLIIIVAIIVIVVKIALVVTIFKLYEKEEEISMQLHNITNLLLMEKNKKQ